MADIVRRQIGDLLIFLDIDNGRWIYASGPSFPNYLDPVARILPRPHDGAIFYRTDLGSFYQWDEVPQTWTLIGGSGGGVAIAAGTEDAGAGTVTFSNSNGVTFGMDASVITASVAAGAADGLNRISAGTQIADTLATVVFSNSNNVSFGMTDSSRITASATFAQSNQQMTLFATGNTTQATSGTSNASSLIFNGAGIASVGITAGSVIISVPAGAPSPVNFSAGTTSGDLGSVVFSNSGGVSFGLNGSTVTATVVTTYQPAGAYLTTAMLSNAVTLSNIRVSAGTTSNLLSAITFADSNGISFGLNAGTLTGTVKTDYLTTAALSNHSHGNPTLNLTNLSGTTASNSAGFTLSLSAAAPGAGGAINFSAGTTSNNLETVVFSNSNGVSFGLNGSTVTGSVNAGGAPNLSLWLNQAVGASNTVYLTNAQMVLWPLAPVGDVFGGNMTPSTMFLNFTGTVSTASSHTHQVSIGFYTMVNSTQLSLAFSASTSWGTNAGNAGQTDSFAGYKWVTIHSSRFNVAPAFSQTQYWMALWTRSSNHGSFSLYGQSHFVHTAARSGFMSAARVSSTTQGWYPFNGNYSVTFSTAMPNAVAASDVNKTGAAAVANFIPYLMFNNMGSNIV